MSDTDESAVLVEHNDAPELVNEDEASAAATLPRAIQIVRVGSPDNAYAFQFDSKSLEIILSRIPDDCKVAVVSVVGAFRTGKSFLLSWFLRYLKHLEEEYTIDEAEAVTEQEEEETAASADKKPWYRTVDTLGTDEGFHWKAGSERDTTGIWMWSHPHFVQTAKGTKLAVLLVDTQGMFDHETTMALTASIFGFSTLLSSYQIYNVDKRIQEDNLQQLALFSEYARTAMASDHVKDELDDDNKIRKPFQRVEFLVRDWQHFEDDDGEEGENEDYPAMEQSMEAYLEKAIAEREAKDLSDTREQIMSCFETVTCYGLSHPGFGVVKKKFTGNVDAMEPQFLHLLDRYCRRVFDPKQLEPKVIHGRELTASELGTYIQTYADLFASGAKFPTAATLLEATASANNTNAVHMAMAAYKDTMDRVAGPHCTNYVRPEELQEEHMVAVNKSLQVFESIATFGSKSSIDEARGKVIDQLDTQWEVYTSLNDGRNPLAGMETYLIPMSVGFGSIVLRWLTDLTCSPYSQVCRTGSEFFSHVYAVVFCFMGIVAITKAQQVKEIVQRLYAALQVMSSAPPKSGGKSKKE